MVSRWCNSASGILLLAVTLTSWPTTTGGALAEYGRVDENTTLPETTSLQGALQGVNMVTRNNRKVYGFRGIPYAEPPVGDLRFRAPVAAGAWNGTFNASSDPNDCPQLSSGVVVGDEDCLYLNVFTPTLPANDNSTSLPVIVFILGGGFQSGSINVGNFGPNFLLDKHVVLVVPNFRIAVLGYLSTGDEASPGNYGLKDIVVALEWVRDNIQYFGGDPNQVTLFGASSGAISTSLLALADSTNGLFHKCITNSGSAFYIELGMPAEVHVNRTIQLAENFGCPTNSTTLAVNCLRGVNASQLIDTYDLFYVWESYPEIMWLPTTEPDIEGALLTDTVENLFAAGKARDVPWLSLVVRDEELGSTMRFYEDANMFEEFLDKIDFVLPYLLGYWSFDDAPAYTAALKSFYVNDLTADRSLLLKNVSDMLSDGVVYWPAYHSLQQQLAFATNPLYFVDFEYRGTFSHTYAYSGGNTNYTGVAHGDDIIYLYEDVNRRFGPAVYEYSEVDLVMVDTMVQLWTSFVINGTPTMGDLNSTIVWEPYSSLNNYLRIGNGSDTALGIGYDLHIERMQFWEELTSSTFTDSSTSGESRTQLQLLPILFCLFSMTALHQRWHGH